MLRTNKKVLWMLRTHPMDTLMLPIHTGVSTVPCLQHYVLRRLVLPLMSNNSHLQQHNISLPFTDLRIAKVTSVIRSIYQTAMSRISSTQVGQQRSMIKTHSNASSQVAGMDSSSERVRLCGMVTPQFQKIQYKKVLVCSSTGCIDTSAWTGMVKTHTFVV